MVDEAFHAGEQALQARTGWATPQLQARLLELEMLEQVVRLPGQIFQRQNRA